MTRRITEKRRCQNASSIHKSRQSEKNTNKLHWTSLDKFELVWTSLNKFKHIWTCLNTFDWLSSNVISVDCWSWINFHYYVLFDEIQLTFRVTKTILPKCQIAFSGIIIIYHSKIEAWERRHSCQHEIDHVTQQP